jgi:transcription factor S
MFCPDCGSILRPKEKAGNKILFCSCGFTKVPGKEEAQLKEAGTEAKKVEVIEHLDTRPKIRTTCEKCKNDAAYYWTQQTRGADEPETRFFKCTKCSFTWREYA